MEEVSPIKSMTSAKNEHKEAVRPIEIITAT